MIKISSNGTLISLISLISLMVFINVLFSNKLIAILIILILFSLLMFKVNNVLKAVFFLVPFLSYFSQISITGNFFTYFLILLFIKYLFESKNIEYDRDNIILLMVVLSVSSLTVITSNSYNFIELIRWKILFIFTVLLMSEKGSNRKFSDFGSYFIAGFFISSIIGLFAFKFGGNVYDLTKDYTNQNIIKRFSGLSGDPNNYGMYALLVLSFLLIGLEDSKNKKVSIFLWGLIVTLGALSVLTVSRALAVGFVLIILAYLILNLRRKKNIKVFFYLIALFMGGFFIGNKYGYFDSFYHRFTHSGSDLSELTGSRNIIISDYISGFLQGDFWQYLFGSGITGHPSFYYYEVEGFNSNGLFANPVGTHNTILELLISFGILGSIPFLLLLFRCVFKRTSVPVRKLRYFDLIPFYVIILYFFSLQSLAKYSFYFILLLISLYLHSRKSSITH